MRPEYRNLPTLDVLLNRENPRHVPRENQEQIIEYLLNNEEIYNLARHISRHGINPLEVIAVFPDDDGNLIAAEGNRRLCAAQLLTDYHKAPEFARSRFKAMSSKSVDVSYINVAVFPDYAAAQPWLQILHDGEQDGVGRRRWKPDQKARATTNKSTNALAVALLDYAEANKLLLPQNRQSIRVSTATRYLANPDVRQAMGLTSSATSDKIDINISQELFHQVVSYFITGIVNKELHSRSTSSDWLAYAAELENTFDTSNSPVPKYSASLDIKISSNKSKSKISARAAIITPETRFIARSDSLVRALNDLSSFKLSSLYASLTSIRLDEHPALLTAGAWIFVESLTALHGRTPTTEFVSYLNSQMAKAGLEKNRAKECKLSLEYISQHGNAQKHSAAFTSMDARNLNNHFNVLDDIFTLIVRECIPA